MKDLSTNQPGNKLNFSFIQKVINVSFLALMMAIFSSFFNHGEKAEGVNNTFGTDPFIGEITIFPYNFAPAGWAKCEGQLLPIAQNTALFSLLGTTYGGDGETTFGLPDLRGRVVIGHGIGPGLPNYQLGQIGGNTNTTLSVANLPPHNHTATLNHPAKNGAGDETNPGGGYPATANTDFYAETPNTTLGDATITINNTGSGTSFTNMQPYLTMGYYIALQGVYPSPN
jgi:microcystin-dependent protein